MSRLLVLTCMWLLVGWSWSLPAAAADGLPPRPAPFKFVNDQANLLSATDAQTLEKGLRRYADKAGPQIVVVTVPSLGGRDVADYARQLGTAWGVGQRDKDNGVVVLLAGQERQVSIQAGSGLRQQITPALTSRIISQHFTPRFKQGQYFQGLRTGLNQLMQAADPSGNATPPASSEPATASNDALSSTTPATSEASSSALETPASSATETPFSPGADAAPTPTGGGFSLGGMLIGALLLGGAVWFITRLFRRRNAAANETPSFYPNQPGGNAGYNQPGGYGRGPAGPAGPAPDFYPNRGAGGMMGGGGSGLGGALLTGAAAAAGAYIGNRMATGPDHDNYTHNASPEHGGTPPLPMGQGSGNDDFPALDGNAGGYSADRDAPDYFSDDATNSPDYFSDDSAYDDTSSDNTGGGGFDDDNSNSGSW